MSPPAGTLMMSWGHASRIVIIPTSKLCPFCMRLKMHWMRASWPIVFSGLWRTWGKGRLSPGTIWTGLVSKSKGLRGLPPGTDSKSLPTWGSSSTTILRCCSFQARQSVFLSNFIARMQWSRRKEWARSSPTTKSWESWAIMSTSTNISSTSDSK